MGKRNRQSRTKANEEVDKREYEKLEYWEERYGGREKKSKTSEEDQSEETDEWCFSYSDLEPILEEWKHKIDSNGLIVDLGCGVSTMLLDMRRDGWQGRMLGIDFSSNAVKAMEALVQQESHLKDISFRQGDLTKLNELVEPETVEMFIDKMTMDSILHLPGDKGSSHVSLITRHIAKALRMGGVFLLVTQMDYEENSDFLSSTLLESLQSAGTHWAVRVHVTEESAIQVYCFEKLPRHSMSLRNKRGQESVVSLKVVMH